MDNDILNQKIDISQLQLGKYQKSNKTFATNFVKL